MDCNGYKRWLEQLLSTKLKRDNHQQIRDRFPWSYHKNHLLKTKCICIPLRQGDYHSVMFVMNVNSLTTMDTNRKDSDGIYEDDKDPVIYHFDCSPHKDTSEANNSPLEFVYSFLNWLVLKKKSGKIETNFNSQNLPICVIHLKPPIEPWISGYNVIKYICVMYNQVIYNGYEGNGSDPNVMTSSILEICNDDAKTCTLLTDLIKLSWSLYNTSLANSELSKTDRDKDNLVDKDTDTDDTDNDDNSDDNTYKTIRKTQRTKSDPSKQEDTTVELIIVMMKEILIVMKKKKLIYWNMKNE